MARRHLFIIDPPSSLNLKLDSSLRMMFALSRLGDEVFWCEPRHLSWFSRHGAAQAMTFRATFGDSPQTFQPLSGDGETFRLPDFSAIHMRKDPPFDMEYVNTTLILDSARTGNPKIRIYNSPEALRSINEKLAILRYPDCIRPALVSRSPAEIFGFVRDQLAGDGIVKPLGLFGGRGVERFRCTGRQDSECMQELTRLTVGGTELRLIQGFDQAVFAGEVRAFTAFGEPIAWCLKKPAAGEYLANTRMGATLHPYLPQPAEIDRVTRIARDLMQSGVALIGFDLIGGYVSEINITSPRLLTGNGDDLEFYKKIATLMAADLGA